MSQQLAELQRVIKSGDYVVLDTETTGLKQGEVCQIGIVGSNGQILLDTLVKTMEPIPLDATRIHGIDNDAIRSAPRWPDIYDQVLKLLSGTHVLVYNAVYDRKMLHQTAERWHMEHTDWKTLSPWLCVMEGFAEVYGDYNSYHGNYRWQPLWRAAEYFAHSFDGEHTAIGDAKMTWKICKSIAKLESANV